jgi:hypothetical protein
MKQYTIIACTFGEQHNCLLEGCCFPEGKQQGLTIMMFSESAGIN